VLARIMAHHDYVWARLPFLAPMALAIARRQPAVAAIAQRLTCLGPLVLDHLRMEEHALRASDVVSAVAWIGDGMLVDHLAIASAVHEIRASVAGWGAGKELVGVERRFAMELAMLDDHVTAQIALEEELLAKRIALYQTR
jgi:hypothetical protein